jgi:selenocysteine lyase/cysteine desulfurase
MTGTARHILPQDDLLLTEHPAIRRPDLFAPATGGDKLNFYGLAVAPEITWIRNSTNGLLDLYQSYVPGSARATSLLLSLAEEARALIRELLLGPGEGESCQIEFVGGTSRAVEIALARSGRPQKLIISPFEHPSVMEVAKWFVSVSGAELSQLRFVPDDYSHDWQAQEEILVRQIAEQLKGVQQAALVLSEVNYATGVRIPVEQVIDRLYRLVAPSVLKIILDGAHAAGNNQYPSGVAKCSSYIFSGHKWLLAPEPCGVILTRKPSPEQLVPYDAWSSTLPATTVNVHMLAGIVSSLRFLRELGLEKLWEHSRELRRRFVARIQPCFAVVGDGSGMATTLLLAVCPRAGKRWKFSAAELAAYLQNNSVHALVMNIDPEMPWIRVAFPCFIDFEHVDILCDVLEGTVH